MVKHNKNLGQHFLIEKEVAQSIVALSGDIKAHNIVEIGPGDGILTEAILQENPLSLVAIEKDKRFLKKHLSIMQSFSNYRIVIDDALKVDFVNISAAPKKIIANIPYNISSKLLHMMMQSCIKNFVSMTFMVQKEFALKLMSGSKLGFLLRMHAEIKCLLEVDKKCFYPVPKVQSAVILITPNHHYISVKHLHDMQMVVEVLFNQKRKILKSTLRNFFPNPEAILSELSINEGSRVEHLSSEELFAIGAKIIAIKDGEVL